MNVGLLIVSHSAKIADGVCELAAQMAPDVRLIPAGGTDDGGIGTSFSLVRRGIQAAQGGDGVVILTDLGSSAMIAESVLELLDVDERPLVCLLAAAPLVEGAIAAAVSAQSGANLATVAAAAGTWTQGTWTQSTWTTGDVPGEAPRDVPTEAPRYVPTEAPRYVPNEAPGEGAPATQTAASGEARLINPMGLHARPAALLAQALATLDAEVSVNGVDAKSVMLLMTLGLQQGARLTATATGVEAQQAVELVLERTRSGFGEV